MESISTILSTETERESNALSRQVSLSPEQSEAISSGLYRLSAEYRERFELTDETIATWQEALVHFTPEEILCAIGRHMMDTTPSTSGSAGAKMCDYPPVIGRIVDHCRDVRSGNEQAKSIAEARQVKQEIEPDTRESGKWMRLIKQQEDIAYKLKSVLRRTYGKQLGYKIDAFCAEVTQRATHPRVMPPLNSHRSEWRDDQYPNGVPDEKIGIDYREAIQIAEIVIGEWDDRVA